MSTLTEARAALSRWRRGATEDRWVPRLTPDVIDRLDEGERVVSFGGYSEADAELIVGTAGNPALLEALDGLFEGYDTFLIESAVPEPIRRIAEAILIADKEMNP